jgi:hypothetical protein
MADARLKLSINRVLFGELRQVASELGSSFTVNRLAEEIVESWAAERRLPQSQDPQGTRSVVLPSAPRDRAYRD